MKKYLVILLVPAFLTFFTTAQTSGTILGLSAQAVLTQPVEFVNYPVPADFPFYETEQLIQSCLSHGLPEHCGGEPSIGVNLATNNALIQMMLTTARINWDDSQNPPVATWTPVSFTGFVRTADPVLTTDRTTGRTFNVQMNPDFPGQGATGIVSTDDEGATWNESIRIYSPDPDKPSVGSGPYHDPQPTTTTYPSAVYFCIGDGFHFPSANVYCYRSDNGGSTWGSATIASTGK